MKKSTLVAAALSGMMLGAAGAAQAQSGSHEVNGKTSMKRMADPPKDGKDAKGPGKGKNACKGKGGCKTDKHACKGQNECKGQGGCDGSHSG